MADRGNERMTLLLATQNAHKIAEIQAILQEVSVEVVTPRDVGLSADFDVAETGQTFAENAELKARAFAAATHLPTLADDSGLEVTALHGRPGVYSKRYVPGTDADRNQKILSEVADATDRTAAFVTVLCLYNPQTDQATFFEGRVTGQLSLEPRGTAGFGYDPIFIPSGYQQTFGELGQELKNQLSHRARALAKVKAYYVHS